MSGQWQAIAHRGQLDLDVLTRRRAVAEGYRLRDGVAFIGLVRPFDGDEIAVAFMNLARVVAWTREMEPRALTVVGVDEPHADQLRAALADIAFSGTPLQ